MKAVLILGLFQNTNNCKTNILTAEERVGAMFAKNNIPVIRSSHLKGKLARLINSVYTLIIKREKYDIAIVPLFGTWPSFLWQEVVTRLLKLFNKKIIIGIHGGSIPDRVNSGATRFLKALRRADVIVAPSAFMQQYFSEKGFSVHIIQNPIDISHYSFISKPMIRPRILWMRAFTDVYNPTMAISVAKKLAGKYDDFAMVMAGKDGLEQQSIKEIAVQNGLDEKVIFPGYVNLEQKQRLAQDYDIYISTNRVDNAPVSIIEFMSMGLPVVSTNVGGIPFIIEDNITGLLVRDNDGEAMFLKICALIENPLLARTIANNARRFSENFDESNIIQKWKGLLNELRN